MEIDAGRSRDPSSMEGRCAIFTEKWIVAIVRVHSIRVTDQWIKARVCAIPTPGLYGKNEIEIGTIHEYFDGHSEIWVELGCCGWRVLFAQRVIDEVLRMASSFPKEWIYDPADVDFDACFDALMQPIREYTQQVAPHPDLVCFNRQKSD
jgi:hypothetical protein